MCENSLFCIKYNKVWGFFRNNYRTLLTICIIQLDSSVLDSVDFFSIRVPWRKKSLPKYENMNCIIHTYSKFSYIWANNFCSFKSKVFAYFTGSFTCFHVVWLSHWWPLCSNVSQDQDGGKTSLSIMCFFSREI